MIGRIVECDGEQIIQTLAGATAGTVCKVGYDSNQDYALPFVLNELGEGYVGISSDATICGPTYNPVTGVLKACCVEAESSNAVGACNVLANGSNASANYNLAFWTSTADGCYCPMGFSSGCAITYNPSTATLTSCTVSGCMIRAACMVVTDSVYSNTSLSLSGLDGGILISRCGNVIFNNHNATGIDTTGTTHLCLTEGSNDSGCGQLFYRCYTNNCLYPTDCITFYGGTTCISNLTTEYDFCALSTAYFSSNACGDDWCIGTNGTACFNGSVTACSGFIGNASSSTITDSMGYTSGWGECEVRAVSTPDEFEGQTGWANYLLFSHGDGSNYYGQAIRMPFWSAPQYFRRMGSTDNKVWHDFITSENISSQTVGTANVLSTDGTATTRSEYNNELNVYAAGGPVTWINYRGGSSEVWIGNGGAGGGKGTLCAANIYGETCVYSNGSPTVTAACFNCCLRECYVPKVCLSGNTVVICTRA